MATVNTTFNKNQTIGILILVPLLLYFKTLFYGFSPMDEQWLIVRNIDYLQNWDNLWRCFAEPVADVYYRPLLTVSFILNAHVGGLIPFTYHLTNLLLHILCVVVLYRLLLKLNTEHTTALLLSLLFSVHPVLTHAVAWVPGRNDVILSLFSLFSFIYLLKHTEDKSYKNFGFHLIFFACALLTKEPAIILPIVYLGILFYKHTALKNYWMPLSAYLMLALSWYLIQAGVKSGSGILQGKSLFDILPKMPAAFLLFAGKLIWPFSASITPTVKNTSLIPGVMSSILIIGACFFPGVKNKRLLLLAALIFFGGLFFSVLFGVSSPRGEHYEHRIYLSLIGIILFISQLNIKFDSRITKQILIALVIAFGMKTFVRSGIYNNPLKYVEEGIADCPDNYMYYVLRGNILYEDHQLEEALSSYNKAIAMQPNRIQSLANRSNVYAEMGEKDLAIADLDAALKLGTTANIFLNKINVYYRFGEYDNALTNFELLARYNKNYTGMIPKNILQHLTQLYAAKKAKQAQTIEINPKQAEALKNLPSFDAAIKENPKNALYYVYRAKAYVDLKRWDEALADLKQACKLDPKNKDYKDYYEALNNSMPH